MTAALLSIGTELTRGELVNTNAAWLGEELTKLGFDVVEQSTVDEDLDGELDRVESPLASHCLTCGEAGEQREREQGLG